MLDFLFTIIEKLISLFIIILGFKIFFALIASIVFIVSITLLIKLINR